MRVSILCEFHQPSRISNVHAYIAEGGQNLWSTVWFYLFKTTFEILAVFLLAPKTRRPLMFGDHVRTINFEVGYLGWIARCWWSRTKRLLKFLQRLTTYLLMVNWFTICHNTSKEINLKIFCEPKGTNHLKLVQIVRLFFHQTWKEGWSSLKTTPRNLDLFTKIILFVKYNVSFQLKHSMIFSIKYQTPTPNTK